MKILFVMRNSGYTRNWEWVIRVLAERGHRVHIGFELERPQVEVAERLACEFPGVTFGYVPLRLDFWQPLLHAIGKTIDYLRYLEPTFREATKLRARARRALSPPTAVLLSSWPLRTAACRRILDRTLRACERAIPTAREIDRYIREADYDVVMATPLVGGECQHDYLRSARQLGRMVVYPVNSWDNLTSKGLVHLVPDRMYVWNEVQHREAVELHGIPSERIAVVGAHSFDHWFDWRPRTTRAAFCAQVGLDPERPFLLYVCSSGFVAADERPVVARWLALVRSDPELARAGVLVRPHPTNGAIWADHPLGSFANVAVWPPVGDDPTDEQRRAAFYDSIHHAAAVVGANTTALIDAAIVGRRTLSLLLPELRGAQEQTLHFRYLLPDHGGPLLVADTPEEHVGHLRALLAGGDDDSWRLGFLRRFVRPHGLDEPAAPRLVDDLERLAAR